MRLNMLDKNLQRLGLLSTLGYIFFSVVPYAIAGKHICTGLMLVAFVALLIRKQIRNIPLDWLSLSLYLVIGLALSSAMLSPYAIDSLNQFRKDGLPFLLGFLLLINVREFDRTHVAIFTVLSLVLGYVAKEVLALWAGATNGFRFSIYEIPESVMPKYLDFFSADTPYYLPFLLGPLCFWPMKPWQRLSLFLLAAMAIAIVIVSGVRTAFVLVVFTIFFLIVYRFWCSKIRMLNVLILFFAALYLLTGYTANPSIARYESIASTQTYQFGRDGSVSERYAILKGVWEVSKDRLLLGYGPGWKKLPTIAEANGHMMRWRDSEAPIDKVTLNYFSYGEGRVNPHNLYMATLFQEGLLGLIAYMSIVLAAGMGSIKMLNKIVDPFQKGIGIACALYLMVYLGGSIAGGTWLPATMLVALVCLMLYRSEPTHKTMLGS